MTKQILISDLPNHPELIGRKINVQSKGGKFHYDYQDVPKMRVLSNVETKKVKNEVWVYWYWLPENENGNVDCGWSGLVVNGKLHKTSYLEVLVLQKSWCSCKDGDLSKWIFMDDGICDCGINKHHYHCPDCGKVKQVG